MISCGNTVLLEDEDGLDQHLCIVVSQPLEGKVVIVSITTKRKHSELTVQLKNDVHPFLKHDSVIQYVYSRVVEIKVIEQALQSGDAKIKEPASQSLLSRAQGGLLESDFTPNGVKAFYREAMKL